MIRLVIADDHALIREGLRKVFSRETDMQVVGEASDASEAIKRVRDLQPDVAVIDFNMPGQSGLDAMQRIHAFHPGLPVLLLSMYPEEDFAIRALKTGAAGFLSKESAAEEIVGAVRRVAAGHKYVSPGLASQLAKGLAGPAAEKRHDTLSNREFQVMRLIAGGNGTRQIADQLLLSVNTIATYRRRILAKLDLRSDVDVTRYALKNGLLD